MGQEGPTESREPSIAARAGELKKNWNSSIPSYPVRLDNKGEMRSSIS